MRHAHTLGAAAIAALTTACALRVAVAIVHRAGASGRAVCMPCDTTGAANAVPSLLQGHPITGNYYLNSSLKACFGKIF